ncbi:FAD-binding oxidoreductase [Kutzneria buriramensis]|uniref:Glycolate oxidase n=1 Tax=Kutzneria buriramensis TaxID=1045776 RepID=A0A3E0GZP7_9PSEU|nr:FAD-linked oxidase C-terminal domain-containing protein [Kutzneria buriramensis]REH34834.1 glycolate oxidase [Kutzneria buriramensis]
MTNVQDLLADAVGSANAVPGADASPDYSRDESLTCTPQTPAFVVRPGCTAEVAAVLRVAGREGIPVTARGSGTSLAGAAIARPDGILVSFERMNAILEIDEANQVAVVQPGVTLTELDAATAAHGLIYPVHPGEMGATVGGNLATNAGGMQAVKYGVTRHNVLGLEAVLATGEVIRAGGRFVKNSTGYDLTQLIAGSEGTLALVTQLILRLRPRLPHQAVVLAPFADAHELTLAVPRLLATGIDPVVLEYVDALTMAALAHAEDMASAVHESAQAYLIVELESRTAERLAEDVVEVAEFLAAQGAADVYPLDRATGRRLLRARERALHTSKAAGANDLLDTVVPRAAMPDFLAEVQRLAADTGSYVIGCGHAGDGNVHLSVFQPDPETRQQLMTSVLRAGIAAGGSISGEHGIGVDKRVYFDALEDPLRTDLMRRIKHAFDPAGILNPGVLFEPAGAMR